MKLMCVGIWAAAVGACSANANEGTVTHVTDGDTLWLKMDGVRKKIRIAGIDAPEICQAWGPQARNALAAKVLGKTVTVDIVAHDKYSRNVAAVQLKGEDVARWMVVQGHAWSYRYREDDGPYQAEQHAAQQKRLGLFAADQPQSPKDFRREHGSCFERR